MITREQLIKIAPETKAKVDIFLKPLNDAMTEFGITTKLRQAAFLSQLLHESGRFAFTSEIASGSAYDNRVDLGNTNPTAIAIAKAHNSTPGKFWKGHGLIQVTGYNNHVAMMMALGIDCVENPTLLCEPVAACRSAGQFWKDNNVNKWADLGNNQAVSGLVNTGSATKAPEKINGLADRQGLYKRAMEAL